MLHSLTISMKKLLGPDARKVCGVRRVTTRVTRRITRPTERRSQIACKRCRRLKKKVYFDTTAQRLSDIDILI